MAGVSVSKKPTATPSLSLSRSGNSYKAEWKFGSSATKESNAARITGIDADISYHADGSKKGSKSNICGNGSMSSSAKGLSTSYKDSAGKSQNHFDRTKFYPYTGKKLSYIVASCRGFNTFGGKRHYAPEKHAQFAISEPKAPTVSQPTVSGGKVKFKVSVPDSSGHNEREYVSVVIKRTINFNTVTGETIAEVEEIKYINNVLTQVGSGTWEKEITEPAWSAQLSKDQYIRYDITATAKGLGGSSKAVKKSVTICYATGAEIKEVRTDGETVTAYFEFADSFDGKKHITSTYLEYADSSAVPSGGWSKIDDAESDSGNVIALGYARNRYTATVGNYIWLRVVTTYLGNDNLSNYSAPFKVEQLYNKPADSEAPPETSLKILDLSEAGADGTSAYVYVGWNAGDYSGTEISWSTDIDAWESTDEPKSKQLEDAAWNRGDKYSDVYPNTTRLKVADLEEGTTYYFRARRYNVEDPTLMTSWTKELAITTGTLAAGVVCSAPDAVAEGDAINVTWLVGGGKEQKSWQLIVDGEVVAGANDGASSYSYLAAEGSKKVSIKVRVVTDSEDNASTSEEVSVTVKPKPHVTAITTNQTITAKPHAFSVTCDTEGAVMKAQLIADGVSSELPAGNDTQYRGDVVWEDESTSSSMAIPESVHLIDTAAYRLVVTPSYDGITGEPFTASWNETVEPSTESETTQTVKSELMHVLWSHQAVDTSTCSVVVDQESMTAQITPQPPSEGYSEGDAYSTSDVCDIYRNTADGCYLIAQGVKFGSTVTDRWSAYGEGVSYRVATRTVDGDVDWGDFDYELSDKRLRIDFEGESIALRYGVSCSDSWAKNVDVRTYLDGTSRGNWNAGATRTKEISAALIKGHEASQMKALNGLAKYHGAVFVRTPIGEAFQASVNVSGFGGSVSSPVAAVTLSCQEVECDTYVCSQADIVEAS